jgi:hypothetical protein
MMKTSSGIISLSLILSFLFFSCRKKDKTEEPAPAQTPSTTQLTGDWGTFLSSYGTNDYSYNGGTIQSDSAVTASFYDTPQSGKTYIAAGTVSVNGVALIQNVGPPIYYAKTNGPQIRTMNWNISGSGTISATSFSYIPSYPNFTGAVVIPDTVSQSAGFNINLGPISNLTNSISVTVFQTASVNKFLATTPGTVNISPTEISSFTDSTTFRVIITAINYSNATLNGKQYGINATRSYMKYVYLKP